MLCQSSFSVSIVSVILALSIRWVDLHVDAIFWGHLLMWLFLQSIVGILLMGGCSTNVFSIILVVKLPVSCESCTRPSSPWLANLPFFTINNQIEIAGWSEKSDFQWFANWTWCAWLSSWFSQSYWWVKLFSCFLFLIKVNSYFESFLLLRISNIMLATVKSN